MKCLGTESDASAFKLQVETAMKVARDLLERDLQIYELRNIVNLLFTSTDLLLSAVSFVLSYEVFTRALLRETDNESGSELTFNTM